MYVGNGQKKNVDSSVSILASFTSPSGLALVNCSIAGYGTNISGGFCFQCPVASYSQGNGVCSPCPAGTFSSAKGLWEVGLCSACLINTYSSVAGVITCTPCPPNSSTGGLVGTRVCSANAGYYYSYSNGSFPMCPASTFSAVIGATACTACMANSWSAEGARVCTANAGYYYYSNGLLCQCAAGFYCVTGVSAGVPCPSGMYCSAGVTAGIPCAIGNACPRGSAVPTPCLLPANASFTGVGLGEVTSCPWQCNAGYFLQNGRCIACVVCRLGAFPTPLCGRNCAPCTVPRPVHSVFVASTPSCPWMCDNGFWGLECAPCPVNYWCKYGMRNKCPLHSHSPALSTFQSACVCDAGYMSTGRIASTSPCIVCPAGVLCNGVPVQESVISEFPLVIVSTQFVLAKKSLPPASSLVSLFLGVPDSLNAIQVALPNTSINLRRVCQGGECVVCDTPTSCIRAVTVGVNNNSTSVVNTTSLQRDVLYFFVPVPDSGCLPQILDLAAEHTVNGSVMIISSAAQINTVRVACVGNTNFVDIPLTS